MSTRATYVAYTVFVSVSRRDRGSLCVYYRAMQRDPIHHIKCSTPMAGRYVSIYADSDPLVLCSVNVYGQSQPPPRLTRLGKISCLPYNVKDIEEYHCVKRLNTRVYSTVRSCL